jgi:hypothetical protein
MRLVMLLSVAMTLVALDAMTLQAGKQGADGAESDHDGRGGGTNRRD